MDSLRNKGLIRVIETEGRPQRVVLTSAGMAAIGVEAEGDEASTVADTAPTSAEANSAALPPAGRSEADEAPASGAGKPAKRKTKARPAKKTQTAPGAEPSETPA